MKSNASAKKMEIMNIINTKSTDKLNVAFAQKKPEEEKVYDDAY